MFHKVNKITARPLMGEQLGMRIVAVFTLSLVISATPVSAQNTPESVPPTAGFVYKPPLRGAPATRISGASRGMPKQTSRLISEPASSTASQGSIEQTVLLPLAPEHVGLTTRPKPVFQWYAVGPLNGKLEFTLNEGQKTVMETALNPDKPGVQSLDLTRYRYSLKPGVEYEWRVALIIDALQPTADLIAGGAVRYEPASAELQAQVKRAKPQELPAIYAEAGQWYDALASVSAQITAHPQEKALRDQRAALLEQVGLTEAAESDRRAATQ